MALLIIDNVVEASHALVDLVLVHAMQEIVKLFTKNYKINCMMKITTMKTKIVTKLIQM